MNCKYYRTRTKKYKKYGYCTKYKKEVSLFCKECNIIHIRLTNKFTNTIDFKIVFSFVILELVSNIKSNNSPLVK